ncbi:hypothetical protein [Streptomyces goshikiensis]|uniref:hypothetical protein n=1 Tax=Streptomyces goshikiensis TaxID=1942 RepID=UPI00366843F1
MPHQLVLLEGALATLCGNRLDVDTSRRNEAPREPARPADGLADEDRPVPDV